MHGMVPGLLAIAPMILKVEGDIKITAMIVSLLSYIITYR